MLCPPVIPAALSLNAKVTCTCGGVFKTLPLKNYFSQKGTSGIQYSCGKTVRDEYDLKEHMRNSARHCKLEEFCAAA